MEVGNVLTVLGSLVFSCTSFLFHLLIFFFQYHIFILLGLMYIEVINSKDRREENAEDNVN